MTYNYTQLVSLVKEQIEDDSTEFETYIPRAVNLVEDRLFRDLDLFLLREFQDLTTTVGTATLNLPSGFESSDNIVFFSDSVMTNVRKKTLDYIKDYWPNKTLTGAPKYYAVSGEEQIYLAPTPDEVYTTEISFTKRPTVLSTGNLTNYFTNNAWSALVEGTLEEMCKFIKDYSVAQNHRQAYMEEVVKHNDLVKTKRLESGMVLGNPQVGTQER
jgi:hypothetical protein